MDNNMNLLLVGRTGNGKSSTGNSILGKKAFTPKSSSSSVTDDTSKDHAQIEGSMVTVCDGPGLGDTGFDAPADVRSAIDMARKVFNFLSSGFHALLIVLKYGVRFTKQEKDAIQMIKGVYGEDVVKKHGIIVMTHGDSYEMDTEDDGTPFETWCRQQGGDVQALFNECGQRCVLFNNKAKDSGRLKEQYNKLMTHVKSLRSRQVPYTMEDFRRAEPSRTKLIVQANVPQWRKKTEDFLDRIDQKARQVEDKPHLRAAGRQEELQRLKVELDGYKDELNREDHGTGLFNQLLLQLSVSESSVRSKIERYKRLADQEIYEDQIRRSREDLRASQYSHVASGGGGGGGGDHQIKVAVKILLVILLLVFLYYFFFQFLPFLFGSGKENVPTPLGSGRENEPVPPVGGH